MTIKKKIASFLMIGVCSTAALAENEPSPHQFSIGLITNYYQYREKASNKLFMEDKGYMVGGVFNYLYTNQNKYIIGTDIDLSGGSVNYKSNGTGSMENVGQIKAEGRIKFGKNFDTNCSITLTTYLGFGVRYKSDFQGGKKTTTGHHGYDRHSTYLYLPIGLKTAQKLSQDWGLECFSEFDVFLYGQQRSDLSGWGTLTHKQKKGYGVRGGFEVIKSLDQKKSLAFGPFINYWNIKNSNRVPIVVKGKTGMSMEPHNNTIEAGIAIKCRF